MLNIEQSRLSDQQNRVNVEVSISSAALPLSCPMANMTLWDMHPKVYLALDADNQATCPYCATHYVLKDE